MNYYAHTAKDENGKQLPKATWQLLKDHLQQVAELAKGFASALGLEREAFLAGLLHDLGKYAARFQARLEDNSIHGINHWAAGAAHAAELRLHNSAFAVDGHHTGMPARDGDGLKQTVCRMRSDAEREGFCKCVEPLSELLRRLAADGLCLPDIPARTPGDPISEALRTRLIFSCLVDADFRDTEKHFDPGAASLRQVPQLDPVGALKILRRHLAGLSGDGGVNRRRRKLLDDCLAAATQPPGLFTLTAPTGSGKTLSSLAFALHHINHHNASLPEADVRRFRRVIVVIPFTSIIEQTADVYRKLFESEFGPDYVLEHHSAVAPRERAEDKGKDAEAENVRRARLASENWASPLVVTTSVRFFESLFSNRPSACRKLHNIGRSVVLFDEVQTLPSELVPSLLSAVKLLTGDYGMTAVFMTATQPAFDAAEAALPYGWNPARNPDAADRLHLPEFYAAYFRELYGLLGPQSVKDDKVFAACEVFDFPKAADECSLIGDETRAVLVKWKNKDGKNRGEELAKKLEEQKHLTSVECREAQRFSVNLYQSEFLDARAKGYIYQPAKDWDFWVWNSKYDGDLGACHPEGEDFLA